MSKLTLEELEKHAEEGKVIKEVHELVTFRDPRHPDVIRKVCMHCNRVFDRFLLCVGGLIGCRECATKILVKRLGELAKLRVDELLVEGKDKLDEVL